MARVRGKRRDVLEMYRRTRPRDVPAEMVEAATARRLAGDVAGACAAARVDLDVDIAAITRVRGRETADQVIDDLHHLAPDLLRWNVPRELRAPGAPIGFGLLRRYPAGGGANLMVSTEWKRPGWLDLSVRTRPADLPVERLVADARRVLDEGVFEPGLSQRQLRPARTIWVECRDEGQAGTDIELTFGDGDQVTARRRSAGLGESRLLTAPEYRHPIDFDLLRFGLVGPDELHPAVTQALFQARSAGADGLPAVEGSAGPPGALKVAARDGGWELMERAVHRDTAGVRALLDAGADPLVRDGSGQTLLHLLPHLDHELLLPRLLAAGVDVNAVDMQGHTALHAAAVRRRELGLAGSIARAPVEDLVARLLNAGGVDVCAERGAPCPAGAPAAGRARPTSEDVDRLRVAAARDEYRSMAELAWALYATGKDRREVLAECYGVPFPDEFFALADQLPLPGHRPEDLRCHVWRLALPADRGGPVPPAFYSSDDYVDHVVLERDRQLVPVLRLDDGRTEYGGVVLCYRLTELARGEPTIFGTDPHDDDGRIERLGPSLLAVLRDYHATVVDRLEAPRRLAPEHHDVDTLPGHRAALHLVGTLLPAGAPGVARSELTAPFTTPVSERTLARLRAGASRDDYRSLARLAWALYTAGSNPREVLAECYGVPFPDEFFVIAEADPDDAPPGYVTSLPWELAVPLDRGGPVLIPSSMTWSAERRILAWDPDLVPLVELYGHGHYWVHHGDLIHCYRLSELAAGGSTVFGVPWHRHGDDGGELSVEPSGQSLLTVLQEYATACLRLDEWGIRQPSNRGAGSIDDDEVEGSRQIVAGIEALQRRLDNHTKSTEQ